MLWIFSYMEMGYPFNKSKYARIKELLNIDHQNVVTS